MIKYYSEGDGDHWLKFNTDTKRGEVVSKSAIETSISDLQGRLTTLADPEQSANVDFAITILEELEVLPGASEEVEKAKIRIQDEIDENTEILSHLV